MTILRLCIQGGPNLHVLIHRIDAKVRDRIPHIFGRPFVKRFAVCYQTVVCLSCLSVCDVGVLWQNGWMNQDETWHGGRPRPRPGHIVLDGVQQPPSFRPMSIVAKRSPISATAELFYIVVTKNDIYWNVRNSLFWYNKVELIYKEHYFHNRLQTASESLFCWTFKHIFGKKKHFHFYRATPWKRGICCCRVSVYLPQVGVLLQQLNVGSRRQRHTIAQGL